mmetsp:Transcript_6908/g.10191  ORF Transcript_6908/g.10191 Transcript_6908/m.10191 type:complete len:106 (+) Transcript_6908:1836-2153(+)
MHGGSHVLHDVGNGKSFRFEADALAIGGGCAAGVDVHGDRFVCAFVVEVEQLGDDELGDGGDEWHTDVDDAVVEEQGWQVWWRTDAHAFFGHCNTTKTLSDSCLV